MSGQVRPDPPKETGPGAAHHLVDASGIQVGRDNLQINYFVLAAPADRLTSTDGVNRPPLVDASGKVESPYRGLGAFGERDAPFFHGREAVTREVLSRLSLAASRSGILVVSGVSGAGKSSLLRAGVLPRIRGEGLERVPGAARWTGLVLTPTRDPLTQLALRAAHLLGTDAAQLHRNLEADPASFAVTAAQLALRFSPPQPDADAEVLGRVLLIIDQFEQVFTQCSDEKLRQKFVTALAAAAEAGAALVVITVRADYYALCADFRPLAAAVKDHYLVTAMDEVELRAAIEGPVDTLAEATGRELKVAPSLVDYLVREVLEIPTGAGLPTSGAGVLPLLSHALDQAWRSRTGSVLTITDYERGGGIKGAVEASARRAFISLTESQQKTARQVFLRLVTINDDGQPARDRVRRDELLAAAGEGHEDDIAEVLAAFTKERLITQAASSVEISHDALLTAWPLLRDDWLAEDHADLGTFSRLRSAAREWHAHSRKPGYLHRGEVLDHVTGAVNRITVGTRPRATLTELEKDFLEASGEAQQKAERTSKIIKAGFATLTVGLAIAVAAAFASLANANRALQAANVQQMSAESVALRDINPAVSMLAATAAWSTRPSQQTRDLAIEAASNPLIGEFSASLGPVAVSPDSSVVVVARTPNNNDAFLAGHASGDVTLWSMTERKALGSIAFPGGTQIYSVAFSPVESSHWSLLAVGTTNGVLLYRVNGGFYRLAQRLPGDGGNPGIPVLPIQVIAGGVLVGSLPGGGFSPVTFRSDGMLATTATATGGDIWLFAPTDGHYPTRPTYVLHNTSDVYSLSFGSDGSLAVGTATGTRIFTMADGYSTPPVTIHEGKSNLWTEAQFGDAGLFTVITMSRTVVERYSAGEQTRVPVWPSAQGWPVALGGQDLLAVAEADGLHLYMLAGTTAGSFTYLLTIPYPNQQRPDVVVFTPDESKIIENISGTVYVYDIHALLGTMRLTDDVPSSQVSNGTKTPILAFDPAASGVLAAPISGAIDLIHLKGKDPDVSLPGTAGAQQVAFSPSGELAVVLSSGVRLFPEPLTSPNRSSLISGAVNSVAFGPDGAMAISTSDAGLTVFPPGGHNAPIVVTAQVPGVAQAYLNTPVFGPSGQLAAVVTATDAGYIDGGFPQPMTETAGVVVFAPGTYAQQGYIPNSSLRAQTSDADRIAFAPDGTLALTTGTDVAVFAPGTYRNPRLLSEVLGISGYAQIAFSGGGILLSDDPATSGGILLWDYQSGQILATFDLTPSFTSGESANSQFAVSPDGRYFADETEIAYGANYLNTSDDLFAWSAPYLDGSQSDGIRFLCHELDGAPGDSQWRQYFTSGLAYPSICG